MGLVQHRSLGHVGGGLDRGWFLAFFFVGMYSCFLILPLFLDAGISLLVMLVVFMTEWCFKDEGSKRAELS